MTLDPPPYPEQIVLGLSRLESYALRRAIKLVLTLRFFGGALFPHRQYRDAVRRVDRKLGRLSDPS